MNRFFRVTLMLIILALSTSNCTRRNSIEPVYYLLNPTATTLNQSSIKTYVFGIGPITLPSYLLREGIATQRGDNLINYADLHRWAQPLDENITQVMLTNLQSLFADQTLLKFPFKQNENPDFQITIDVVKFIYIEQSEATLSVNWNLIDSNHRNLHSQSKTIKLAVDEFNYGRIVKTQSDLLFSLAQHINETIIEILDK